jgi:hypothetical protein
MLALEHVVTGAACLFLVPVVGPATPPSSSTIRKPITQPYSGAMRVIERGAVVTGKLPVLLPGRPAATGTHSDVFTAEDMAVLAAVGSVTVEDDFDYDSLLDYDD